MGQDCLDDIISKNQEGLKNAAREAAVIVLRRGPEKEHENIMKEENQTQERQLVIVYWSDSKQPTSHWQFLEDIQGASIPVACASVGWLLDDSNEAVKLCANMGDRGTDSEQGSAVIVIPRGCITGMHVLNAGGAL